MYRLFYDFVRSPVVPLANQRNAVAGICKTLHGITTWLQYVYDQRASDYEDAYEKEMYEDHPYFCDDTNPPDYSYEACPPDTEDDFEDASWGKQIHLNNNLQPSKE